jgi:hypothetical protein
MSFAERYGPWAIIAGASGIATAVACSYPESKVYDPQESVGKSFFQARKGEGFGH